MSASHHGDGEAMATGGAEPPAITLIVPFFNDRATVRRAIDSALAQRYPRLEVVAVDDGSTDGSADQLLDLEKDGRITLLQQPNQGLGAARDTGARHAAGDLIGFLDADDTLHPDKVAAQLECLRAATDGAIVYCGSQVLSEAGDFLRVRGCRPQPDLFVDISEEFRRATHLRLLDPGAGFPADASQFMARATYETLGGFRRDLRRNTGFEFAARASRAGTPFWLVNAPLYVQYSRAGSARSRFDGRIESLVEVLAEVDRTAEPSPKLGSHMLQITFGSFDRGSRQNRAELWRLLQHRPELSRWHALLLRCGAAAPTAVTRPLARLFRLAVRRARRRRQQRLDAYGRRQLARVEERFGS